MSSDAKTFVAKYAPSTGDVAVETRMPEHPISGELRCFGVAPDNRRPPAMLVLRLKTGDQKALMYAYLVEVDFNPSTGIRLRFVSHEVTIRGRNLEPLFTRLVEHRVGWIEAVDDPTAVGDGAPVVAAIDIRAI